MAFDPILATILILFFGSWILGIVTYAISKAFDEKEEERYKELIAQFEERLKKLEKLKASIK